MKGKTGLQCLAALLALAISPTFAIAQNAGFQIGIAQPRPVFVTQAPAIVTRGTFVAMPAVATPFPQAGATISLVPNFPTVIIPNQMLLPGQTMLSGPALNPAPVVFFPANPMQPAPPFAQPLRPGLPLVGAPRTDVLRQYGPPSVTVITSTGETLYFTGGVTVIIQNGQVAGPR